MKLKFIAVVFWMAFGCVSAYANSDTDQSNKQSKSAATLKPVTKADYGRWIDSKTTKRKEPSNTDPAAAESVKSPTKSK